MTKLQPPNILPNDVFQVEHYEKEYGESKGKVVYTFEMLGEPDEGVVVLYGHETFQSGNSLAITFPLALMEQIVQSFEAAKRRIADREKEDSIVLQELKRREPDPEEKRTKEDPDATKTIQ